MSSLGVENDVLEPCVWHRRDFGGAGNKRQASTLAEGVGGGGHAEAVLLGRKSNRWRGRGGERREAPGEEPQSKCRSKEPERGVRGRGRKGEGLGRSAGGPIDGQRAASAGI